MIMNMEEIMVGVGHVVQCIWRPTFDPFLRVPQVQYWVKFQVPAKVSI